MTVEPVYDRVRPAAGHDWLDTQAQGGSKIQVEVTEVLSQRERSSLLRVLSIQKKSGRNARDFPRATSLEK
jgi:hypothetical protein